MNYVIERLKEPSTWRGIALVLSAFGVHVAPELLPTIGTAFAAGLGAIEMIRRG